VRVEQRLDEARERHALGGRGRGVEASADRIGDVVPELGIYGGLRQGSRWIQTWS
jgi:hypothetical protein